MDFAKQIEYNRRLLVEDIFRRLETALQPVADALNDFFAVLFSGRLPANWREQWHTFIAGLEAAGYRVAPKSVQEFEDWIEAWARYCQLLPAEEARAVSAAPDASNLLVPKLTTTQTVPRYRAGRIVGGMGGDVSVPGQSLSEAVPIFFEVAVTVGGVLFEPLDWALTAREIWNDPTSGWSYAGLIPFIPAGAGKVGKALGRAGDEVSEVAEAATKYAPNRKAIDTSRTQHGVPIHDATAFNKAKSWEFDPLTVEARFNQQLIDASGRAIPGFRPDAQRIRTTSSGKTVVDILEVRSPGQSKALMDAKMDQYHKVLGDSAGDIQWTEPIKGATR